MTWAAQTKRAKQKSGAWTKKKIRRQRAAIEAARSARDSAPVRVGAAGRLPHELSAGRG